MPTRVLIADEAPTVQVALRVLLEQQPGFEVVGEAVDAGELLAQAELTQPDLLLLSWDLGQVEDDLLPTLRQVCPTLYVIALSGRLKARQAALEAGADAFVSKGEPPERLLAAIDGCRQAGTTKPVYEH
jgi:DNA-binding NarL/FixJ family response regulator